MYSALGPGTPRGGERRAELVLVLHGVPEARRSESKWSNLGVQL